MTDQQDASAAATKRAPAKEIFGWCMFDFANSAYTTMVVTLVFSVYFVKLVAGGGRMAELYWSIGLTAANLLAIVLAPLIGAMADSTGHKKRYLIGSCLICVVATAFLYFIKPGMIVGALLLLVFSHAAFSLGEGLCSSYLPELAPTKDLGKISGLGWGLGYVGGLAVIGLSLPLTQQGFSAANVPSLRLSNLVTAGFFLIAALPTFFLLKDRSIPTPSINKQPLFKEAGERVLDTLKHLAAYRNLFSFFVVMLFYNAGLTTVIAFATIYAEKTLGFNFKELVILFLLLQITASLGAIVFGFIQDRIGIKKGINLTLILWVAIILAALLTRSKLSFYIVANFAGLGLGSLQAATRAMAALLTPEDRIAQTFGFMTLFWKLAYALGPLSFGLGTALFASQRAALIFPLVYFIIGLVGLQKIREEKV